MFILKDERVATDTSHLASRVESEARYVNASGDILKGDLDMSQHKILNLPLPTDQDEVCSKRYCDTVKSYVDEKTQSVLEIKANTVKDLQGMELSNLKITALALPTDDQDASSKVYVDRRAPPCAFFRVSVNLGTKKTATVVISNIEVEDASHINFTMGNIFPYYTVRKTGKIKDLSCILQIIGLKTDKKISLQFFLNSAGQLGTIEISGKVEIVSRNLTDARAVEVTASTLSDIPDQELDSEASVTPSQETMTVDSATYRSLF